MAVLVLNASYEPLNVVSVRRAVVLLLMEKAQLLEAADERLRAERISLPQPTVIRLVSYVKIPYGLRMPLSRRGILTRDRLTCQYCGAQPGRASLTLDHVVPRSRGGQRSWQNLVAACSPCNRRKGDRSPREAGMTLAQTPRAPRYVAFAWLESGEPHDAWSKYLAPYRDPARA